MIRLGLIGLGNMGTFQADSFSRVRACRLVAGADVSPVACERFSQKFPEVRVIESPKAMLADKDLDAVIVVCPTLFHKQHAIDALRAGKHVLCEKPMARTVGDGRKMIEAARRARRLLMVAHCRRFDPKWLRLARLVRNGTLGRPLLWRSVVSSRGPGDWFLDDKIGGGPLFDGAIHNYDFANMMFGAPVRVNSHALKLDPKVTCVDTGTSLIEYRRGDQLLVTWSWAHKGANSCDVLGPKGSLIFGPGRLCPPAADQGEYAYFCLTNSAGKDRLIRIQYDPYAMYVNQARHFVDCIRGKVSKCLATPQDALKAVAVGEAVLKTAVRGGTQAIKI